MDISKALENVKRIFLDTAPIIYFIEKNSTYHKVVTTVFEKVDNNLITVVTSPITLAECLIHPLQKGLIPAQQNFLDLIVNGYNVTFKDIDYTLATEAAKVRVKYNLKLPDAFQLAAALATGCEAFLTNDTFFRRVNELQVIILDDFLNGTM